LQTGPTTTRGDHSAHYAVLDQVAGRGSVVGFDVVELNPALDAERTHFLSEILEST